MRAGVTSVPFLCGLKRCAPPWFAPPCIGLATLAVLTAWPRCRGNLLLTLDLRLLYPLASQGRLGGDLGVPLSRADKAPNLLVAGPLCKARHTHLDLRQTQPYLGVFYI